MLKHLHHERKMQLSSVFGQSFFTFNLSKLCQDVHDSCLHCVSHFYKNKSNKALGPERQFNDCMTPNYVFSFDTMYLPKSGPYSFLLIGVEGVSSYVTLYPLKSNTVQEVINSLTVHLTLIPHFSVAKTDFGPEMSRQLTEFLAMMNIPHYSSVAMRSQSQGQPEIKIKIIRNLMNKITDASNLDRNKWAAMLPFISQTINRTHLSSVKGLSRAQLLFSPYI